MLDGQTSAPGKPAAPGRGSQKTPANRPIPHPPPGGQMAVPVIAPRGYLNDFASPRPKIGHAPRQFHVAMAPIGDCYTRHEATDRMKSLRPFIKALAFALGLLLPMSVAADVGKSEQTIAAAGIRGTPIHVDRFPISVPDAILRGPPVAFPVTTCWLPGPHRHR